MRPRLTPHPRAHRVLPSLGLALLGGIFSARGSAGCLPDGSGYLRARVRGSLAMKIDYKDAQLECGGEPRPDGSGVRLSFAGPMRRDGRRVRMVFGVGHAREGRSARTLPTNLTLMIDGEHRLFSTRGEDRCSIDELQQVRLADARPGRRSWRVSGRGFCLAPAVALAGSARVLVSEFDFAGRVDFGAP